MKSAAKIDYRKVANGSSFNLKFHPATFRGEEQMDVFADLQQMERDLAELGDAQGVTAMRERAAAERSKIDEIEDNLEAVRTALCG